MYNNIQYGALQPYAHNNSTNINFGNNTLWQTKVDIGNAKLLTLKNDKFDYSKDDGKISPKDKLTNFAKGLITPITTMFSSPRNFLVGIGMITAAGALTAATGGVIAPLFVALGVAGGVIQLGTSIYKASKATTDNEAKSAWQGIGTGTSAVGMSVLGSKTALKSVGFETKGMSFLRATIECFKQVPSSVSKSIGAFTSGEVLVNLHLKPKKTQSKQDKPPKQNITDEPKSGEVVHEQKTTSAPKAENKLVENFDDLSGEEQYREWNSKKQDTLTYEEILEDANFEVKSADNGFNAQQYLDDIDDLGKVTVKKQTQPKSIAPNSKKTIVQNDGTKITLTYDENGQIAQSMITKPDKTIAIKEYENGKCVGSYSMKKTNILDSKEFKYTNNGKIISIQNGNSKKIFNYNQNGEFIGYSEFDYPNNVVRVYNTKGKLTNTTSDFSADIENAINKLNGKQNFDRNMLIQGKKVVRKTSVIDKQTGNTVDAYITEANGGWGANKKFNIYVENAGEYESIGAVTVDPNTVCEDGYVIKNLYGSQSQTVDRYKGAGTELLKQCSIDSFNYGNKGIFSLQSGNFESDAFYRHIGLHGTAGHFELAECNVSDFLLR